jgi:ribosomal protein S18 acetylase RimI-like enzyme
MALIREMSMADYERTMALLVDGEGVRLRAVDSKDAVERYLRRNVGLSFVAEDNGQIVGCIMSGHDGRRGYLQHLYVSPTYRRNGIGQALVSQCLEKLKQLGISKAHIDILTSNQTGVKFWEKHGWQKREDIYRFSFINSPDGNA